MSGPGFFNKGVTNRELQACGNTPVPKELFAMLLIIIENSLAHDFRSDIGIASNGGDFFGAAGTNRSSSSGVTEASDDKVFPVKNGGELTADRPAFRRTIRFWP